MNNISQKTMPKLEIIRKKILITSITLILSTSNFIYSMNLGELLTKLIAKQTEKIESENYLDLLNEATGQNTKTPKKIYYSILAALFRQKKQPIMPVPQISKVSELIDKEADRFGYVPELSLEEIPF